MNKDSIDVKVHVFVNKRNHQISVCLPKKKLYKFFGIDKEALIPAKIPKKLLITVHKKIAHPEPSVGLYERL